MVLVTIIRKRVVEVLFEAGRDNVKVVFFKGVRCVLCFSGRVVGSF